MPTKVKVPDYEGQGYSFHRGELTVAGEIFTAFTNIKADQPTENAAIHGTQAFPLNDTEGVMDLGEGSITWSDVAEIVRLVEVLAKKASGDGYRTVKWSLMWILTAPGRPNIKKECFGCRQLSEPTDDERGAEALGGETTFSFMAMAINGKFPHKNQGKSTSTSGSSSGDAGVGGAGDLGGLTGGVGGGGGFGGGFSL